MSINQSVGRLGDEGPESGLLIQTDDQGDVYVTVKKENRLANLMAPDRTTVRFCTLQGGGRSSKVRKALLALRDAIQEENERDPRAAWDADAPTVTAAANVAVGAADEWSFLDELLRKPEYKSAYAKLDSYTAGDRKHQVGMSGDELCAASAVLDEVPGLLKALRTPTPTPGAEEAAYYHSVQLAEISQAISGVHANNQEVGSLMRRFFTDATRGKLIVETNALTPAPPVAPTHPSTAAAVEGLQGLLAAPTYNAARYAAQVQQALPAIIALLQP